MAFLKLMVLLEAEYRGGLAFGICLKINTKVYHWLKAAQAVSRDGNTECLHQWMAGPHQVFQISSGLAFTETMKRRAKLLNIINGAKRCQITELLVALL